VLRVVYPTSPRASSTPFETLGQSLLDHIVGLLAWAETNAQDVLGARALYDAQRKASASPDSEDGVGRSSPPRFEE
jgi:hypothetical protein